MSGRFINCGKQLTSSVWAALFIAQAVGGTAACCQSSQLIAEVSPEPYLPGGSDNVLFRPRWSLPLNGSICKPSDNDQAKPSADNTSGMAARPALKSVQQDLRSAPSAKSAEFSSATAIRKKDSSENARNIGTSTDISNIERLTLTPPLTFAPAIEKAENLGQLQKINQVQKQAQKTEQIQKIEPVKKIVTDKLTDPEPQETAETIKAVRPDSAKLLQSGVSVWDTANVGKILEHLVDIHCSSSKEAQQLDKDVSHFSGFTQRGITAAKDSFCHAVSMEGTDPSQRGGKLILDDKIKVRDKATAEYQRQQYVDKIHSQVVSSMMQVAMGLGVSDRDRREKIVGSGYASLVALVGDEEAGHAVQSMTNWLGKIRVPESAFKAPAWDTIERDAKLESIIRAALEHDAVVTEIKKRVERYAHPNKAKARASKVIDTTLSAVSLLSPGFAVPLTAEAALDAYIMATGGSEELKLEKELVYDKRIQSRLKVLDQEATLALDNYRFALVTHNPSLLAFSQAIISDMASEPVASQLISRNVTSPDNTAGANNVSAGAAEEIIPLIKESKFENPAMINIPFTQHHTQQTDEAASAL